MKSKITILICLFLSIFLLNSCNQATATDKNDLIQTEEVIKAIKKHFEPLKSKLSDRDQKLLNKAYDFYNQEKEIVQQIHDTYNQNPKVAPEKIKWILLDKAEKKPKRIKHLHKEITEDWSLPPEDVYTIITLYAEHLKILTDKKVGPNIVLLRN